MAIDGNFVGGINDLDQGIRHLPTHLQVSWESGEQRRAESKGERRPRKSEELTELGG